MRVKSGKAVMDRGQSGKVVMDRGQCESEEWEGSHGHRAE